MTISHTFFSSGLLAVALCAALPVQAQEHPQHETAAEKAGPPGSKARTDLRPDESMSSLFSADPIFMDGVSGFRALDGREFIIDRRGRTTLFTFTEDREVWSLESVPGPRGDEFLKNDIGRIFVRLTDLGGAILFDPAHPDGLPVDPIEGAPSITLPASNEQLSENLSTYLTLRLNHLIHVAVESNDPASTPWLEDAAQIAAKGMIHAQEQSAEIVELIIRTAAVPDMQLTKDGTFIVYVDPASGFEGRPSSDRILLYLKGRLTS